MPTNSAIRDQVTKQVIAAIESGKTLPWRQPWTTSPNSGRPANFVSGKAYSGVNPLLLQIHANRFGFRSKWWGTYRQWSEVGASVKRRPEGVSPGNWGATVVFYKPVSKKRTDDAGDEHEDRYFLLRTYSVFCADQVEGGERFQVSEAPEGEPAPDFAPADHLIEATGANIQYGGDRAFYHRNDDLIQLPPKHCFDPPGSFYETAFHELAHWSESRLAWDHEKSGYAMGELVAELSASFLSQELGVPQGESLENHAAYLRSWLQAMKGDSSFIFRASSQASKVADFLLSFVQDAGIPEPALVEEI